MYPWPLVKIHISWLIASWCVGVVAGVVVVMSLPAGLFAGMGWLLLSTVIMLPMVKTQRRWMALLAVMSGLIFAGIDPVKAIKYQIMVTFMLLSTASLSTIIAGYLTYRKFFNARHQLVVTQLKKRP